MGAAIDEAQPVTNETREGIGDVQPVANETRDRIITGTVTALPFLALVVVGWQLWNDALRWSDVIVFMI